MIEIDVYFKELLEDEVSTRAAEQFLQATANELGGPVILTEQGTANIWNPLTLDLGDETVLARIDPIVSPPRPDLG